MTLYFLRHGEAAPREDPKYPKDYDRPLTKQGVKEMLDVADAIARLGIAPDVILTSPLVRARQTAEMVADMIGMRKRLFETPALGGGFDLRKLNALLNEHSCEKVMLVGHEPDFSMIISELVGGANVAMKKAGLARVDVQNSVARGKGELVWLLAPKVLLAIGKK